VSPVAAGLQPSLPTTGDHIPRDTQSDDVSRSAAEVPAAPHIPPRGTIPSMARLDTAEKALDEIYLRLKGRSIGEYTDAQLQITEEYTEHEANFITLVRAALHERAPWLPADKLRVSDHLTTREIKIFWKQATPAKAA
jgi:hypothetical protein